jgi:hypothetical protein
MLLEFLRTIVRTTNLISRLVSVSLASIAFSLLMSQGTSFTASEIPLELEQYLNGKQIPSSSHVWWYQHSSSVAITEIAMREFIREKCTQLHNCHHKELSQFRSQIPQRVNATLTPFAGCKTISDRQPGNSPPLLSSTRENCCRILTTVYPISVRANCCPMQILGPPLNGTYVQDLGVQEFQREGSNFSGSGKAFSGSEG